MSEPKDPQLDQNAPDNGEGEVFVFPPSFGQRRLWFLDQLEPGSAAYNISSASRLHGEVNEAALQTALDELIARHESLRTTFDLEDEQPVQLVDEQGHIPLQVIGSSVDEASLQRQLSDLSKQGFDLSRGPLLRAYLLKQSDTESVLLLVIHHIIADAWSLGILYKELVQLYEAACNNSEAGLPEPEIQYGDYAEWQEEWLASDATTAQLDYWKEKLSDADPVLELPFDHPRPRVQTTNGATVSQSLSPELAAQLKTLAQQQGCTLFILLLTAFQVFLARYSGQRDIVIGTPIAGRNRRELEPLIGFFVNTLALRGDLSGNPEFLQLLSNTKDTALEAYRHQELPFEKLVEEIAPERQLNVSPLFQVLFVLEHAAAESTPFSTLRAESMSIHSDTAKFDLSLYVTEGPDFLLNTIEYNTDLFDKTTVEAMLPQFETLLKAIVAQPSQHVDELPLLSAEEQRTVLQTFNDTGTDYGTLPLVHARVEAQAAATPDAVAVQGLDRSLSYAELNALANRLARLIHEKAGNGQLIAISAERSVEMTVAALAVLKSGNAYVPVDPDYPADRIAYMLNDAKAAAVVTNIDSTNLDAQFGDVDVIRLQDLDMNDASVSSENLNLPVELSAPLYAIYTSGSTGLPKGVVLTHEGLSNLIAWQQSQPSLDTPARTLQFASLSFDVSFQELFTTWSQGGTLVMIDEALRKDLNALAGFVSSENIERVYMPFAALQPLADVLSERTDLPLAIKDVISAGEQLQVTNPLRALFNRTGAQLHNQYGPSETHVVTALTLEGEPDSWPALPTIGYPVANTRCYILDDAGNPVPQCVPGELYLAGVQVAREYLNRPELTAEKFTADPFVSGERMYRTGDRACYLKNGEIQFLGRADDQVKFRGFRIEPGEIEARLTEAPGVQLATVVLSGEGAQKKLVAYATGGNLDANELRAHLKEQLPDYMVPTHFVILDEMPVTPSGKIARRQLPEPEWERDAADAYTAPRNEAEESLAVIWSDVLGVEQVGVHDNFFDLGGHSLLATQVIARIRSKLGIDIPLIHLFESPTIAEFATYIGGDAADAADTGTIQPRGSDGPAPLSFAQQRLWFLEQLDPGNPAYNFPMATRFRGELNRAALQQALEQLIERHESLRTRFVSDGKTPLQEVVAATGISIEEVDASDYPQPELFDTLTELSQLPFDLSKAPLLRAHLLKTGKDEHVLLLGTHHIVSDGWSLSILFNDFATLYNSAASGSNADLESLPIQYADYATWQKEWLTDEELERQLNFWRDHLAGADPVLELPTDFPRPAEQSYRGGSVLRILPKDLSERVGHLVQNKQSTLFMTLLAAFNVLLARYARQDSIVVGTPIAGRTRPELEGLIGFFSNTLALHSDLSTDPAFTDLLQTVKDNALQAFSHQDLPFEKLVEELQPERDMSHSPIFQTMFVLQNTPQGNTRFEDVVAETVNFEMGITKFDLLMEARETNNGLQVGIQYNSDLFTEATADRMLGHFEQLLASIVDAPETQISKLSTLTDAERQTVVQRFNDTAVNYAGDGSTPTPQQLVELQVEKTPDHIAVEFNGQQLSYRELNEAANRLARQLIEHGAGAGRFVGICAPRSIEALTAVLAVLKTGAAYVPMDPDYPAERLSYMLENSQVPVLLTHSSVADKIPDTGAARMLLDQPAPATPTADAGNLNITTAPDDPLYAIYTSGSTGLPKGAVLPQRSLANLINWQIRRPGFTHAARTLQYASLSFDVHHQEIFSTWATGGTLVLIDQELRQDIPALVRFLSEQKVQRLWMPFAALQPTAEIIAQREDLEFSLEQMCTSGEQLQITPLIRDCFVKHPDIGFHNEYGPSEAHVVSVYSFNTGAERWMPLPPIGKPVTNTQLYVLDANQSPCPVGVPGELYIGGTQTGLGYLGQPDLTAEKFLPDTVSNEGRLYRSGDLVRWLPDGNIAYLGRADDQVKYRGFRIEPGEIEAALARCEGVRLAAVLLREDKPADKKLVGYVTPEPGKSVDTAGIKSALQDALPEYMVPSFIVILDEMPVTPSGKISRRDLPAPDVSADADSYIEPANDTERQLAELWQEVLGIERAGAGDDFFDLGGHSLLATQLVSRIRDVFGIELPLKYVFRNSTVRSLAEHIGALQMAGVSSDSDTDWDEDDDMEEFQI